MKKINMLTDEDLKKMKKVDNQHDKYVDKEYKFYLSYQIRVILMLIVITLLCLGSYLCFRTSFSLASKKTLLVYKDANVDNEVKVFDGELFINNGEEGNIYLSDVIDDINVKLNYVFNGSLEGNYYYDYVVDANMVLKDEKGRIISNSTDRIVPVTTRKNESLENINKLNINEDVVVDYDLYNKKALAVKNSYGVDVSGELNLKYIINVYGKLEGFEKDIKDTQEIYVKIPLLSNKVDVNLYNTELESAKYSNFDKPRVTNSYLLYLGIVLLIVAVIIGLLVIAFIYSVTPKKTKYCALRDGILKDYGHIIVNSKKIPKIEKYNIIDCYSFSELLDAQKLVDKPIVYYEIVKNQKCMFFLIGENDIYKFVLKECDIDY